MGVIQRQSFKYSTVSYIGVLLGTISTLWIYPNDLETYGFAQFLISVGFLFFPILNLGISNLTVRFFPAESKTNGDKGFFIFIVISSLVTYLISTSFLLFYKVKIVEFLISNGLVSNSIIIDNFNSVLILSFLIIFINIFSTYIGNYMRIVIPNIISNFSLKIILPLLVFLHYKTIITNVEFKNLLLISYFFILIAILIYVIRIANIQYNIHRSIISTNNLKSMAKYASLGIIGGIGGMITFRIDNVMISTMIDNYHTGIYSLVLFIANVIEIPYNSVFSITTPIISTSWKNNNLKEIELLYKKSSLNLLIIGAFIFTIIFTNVSEIFQLTSKANDLNIGVQIFLYLGLAKVINMTTGLNDQIIAQSKHYYFNLVAIILLGILTVTTNYFLINKYGVVGAAIGTLISLSTYNLIKLSFIWIVFKMQPLNINHLKVVLIISATGFITFYFSPKIDILFVPIIIKSFIFSALCLPLLYFFRVSEDYNKIINQVISKIRKFSQ